MSASVCRTTKAAWRILLLYSQAQHAITKDNDLRETKQLPATTPQCKCIRQEQGDPWDQGQKYPLHQLGRLNSLPHSSLPFSKHLVPSSSFSSAQHLLFLFWVLGPAMQGKKGRKARVYSHYPNSKFTEKRLIGSTRVINSSPIQSSKQLSSRQAWSCETQLRTGTIWQP